MGPFLELLGALALPLAVAALLEALSRRARVAELERRVAGLERRLRAGVAPARAAVSEERTAERTSVTDAAPEPVVAELVHDEPTVDEPVVAERIVAELVEPEPDDADDASPEPRRAVDWERWIGVRGFAVAGGVVLALAAILLFRHALQNEWLGPRARVATGLASGVLLVGAGLASRRRGYVTAPNALEGAGVVALFASVWAAHQRYALVGLAVSFPAMVAVTAGACLLALRYRSPLTAVLGLAGGFATPVLLAPDADRPLGLFAYVLALDVGLLLLGRRRRWAWLGVLALLGTVVLEGRWIFTRMGPDRAPLGLAVLGVFALLFAGWGALVPRDERRAWAPAQSGAVLVPFAFALWFTALPGLADHVWPTALLLAVLAVAAGVVGAAQGLAWLPVAGFSAAVAVVAAWAVEADWLADHVPWELAAVLVGLSALSWILAEWEARGVEPGARRGLGDAAVVTATAGLAVAAITCGVRESPGLGPPLLLVVATAALLARLAAVLGREWLTPAAAAGAGLALAVHRTVHGGSGAAPDPRLFAALLVLLGAGCLALSAVRGPERGRGAAHAAGVFVLTQVDLFDAAFARAFDPWLLPLLALANVALLGAAATRLRHPGWLLVAAVWAVGVTAPWVLLLHGEGPPPRDASVALALSLAVAALATAWPAWVPRAAGEGLALRRVAPASLLAWFPAVHFLYRDCAEVGRDVVPALLLAAVGAVAALRHVAARDGAARPTDRAWSLGACALLLAFALARAAGTEVPAVALALFGLAMAALARRLGHGPAGWPAAGALAGATALLLLRFLVPEQWAREDALLWNRLSFAHVVPAACALAAAWLLHPWPGGAGRLGPTERAVRDATPGACAIAVVFLWINLLIVNGYATGDWLSLVGDRLPQRDLTLSLAWALYALALLGLGTLRDVGGLRWASLALLLLAIAKAFLYDLDELEGLYRVASLTGLAVALISVSLCYQRFVFRRAPA